MYAHYALHEFHLLPMTFNGMDAREKAFICASIDKRIEDEEKAQKKAERRR